MTFDTLAVATELKEAGFTSQQAEALARAWSHVASGDLATKSDIAAVRTDLIGFKSDLEKQIGSVKSDLEKQIADVRTELKSEIADVRTELKSEIADVRTELKSEIADVRSDIKTLRWMIGFAMGLLVLILGKLFLIHV